MTETINKLQSTDKDTLSGVEMAGLNRIDKAVVEAKKEEIGNRTFTIDGNTMSVREIVKNMTFSVDNNVAYINGKAIATSSELGAALQLYAIANYPRKSIGKIDGWLGPNSNKVLEELGKKLREEDGDHLDNGLNRGNEGNGGVIDNADEVKEQSVERLANAIYTEYVGEYKNEEYDLLSTKPGINKGTLKQKEINGNYVTIKYKSKVTQKYQNITVDASKSKTGRQYSVDKFGAAIVSAIEENEDILNTEEGIEFMSRVPDIITKGVESLDVSKLDPKTVAFLQATGNVSNGKMKFSIVGTGISYSNTEGLKLGKVTIPKNVIMQGIKNDKGKKETILKNRKFNEAVFVKIFDKRVNKSADIQFNQNLEKSVGGFGIVNLSTLDTEKGKYNKVLESLNRYKGLKVTINPETIAKIEGRSKELTNWENYKTVSGLMEQNVAETIQEANENRDRSDDQNATEIKKLKNLLGILKGRSLELYEINVHKAYVNVGKENAYKNLIAKVENEIKGKTERMKNKADAARNAYESVA